MDTRATGLSSIQASNPANVLADTAPTLPAAASDARSLAEAGDSVALAGFLQAKGVTALEFAQPLSPQGLACLAAALVHTGVEQLKVPGLTDAHAVGAEALLARGSPLKRLAMAQNEFTGACAALIGQALRRNTTLEMLDLRDSRLDSRCYREIMSAVCAPPPQRPANTTLKAISFANNGFIFRLLLAPSFGTHEAEGDEDLKALRSLGCAPGLQTLDLSNTGLVLSDAIVRQLFAGECALVTLNLSTNGCGTAAQLTALRQAIASSRASRVNLVVLNVFNHSGKAAQEQLLRLGAAPNVSLFQLHCTPPFTSVDDNAVLAAYLEARGCLTDLKFTSMPTLSDLEKALIDAVVVPNRRRMLWEKKFGAWLDANSAAFLGRLFRLHGLAEGAQQDLGSEVGAYVRAWRLPDRVQTMSSLMLLNVASVGQVQAPAEGAPEAIRLRLAADPATEAGREQLRSAVPWLCANGRVEALRKVLVLLGDAMIDAGALFFPATATTTDAAVTTEPGALPAFQLTPPALDTLAQALPGTPVRHLGLEGCVLDAMHGPALAQMLGVGCRLQSLAVDGLPAVVMQALQANTSLAALSCAHGPAGEQQAALAAWLPGGNIEALSLHASRLDDTHAEALYALATAPCKLTHLQLGANALSGAGMRSLADGLRFNRQLQTLGLDACGMDMQDAACLFAALGPDPSVYHAGTAASRDDIELHNRSITTLDLAGNPLFADVCSPDPLAAVHICHAIEQLLLNDTNFEGAPAFACELLRRCPNLQHVGLAHLCVPHPAAMHALATALAALDHLASLDLQGMHGAPGYAAFARELDALLNLPGLRAIHLPGAMLPTRLSAPAAEHV
jgi:hypothetical protein